MGYCPLDHTELDTTEAISMHARIEEENGNPLQYFCLDSLRNRGAWWSAIYGVAESDMTEVTWQLATVE